MIFKKWLDVVTAGDRPKKSFTPSMQRSKYYQKKWLLLTTLVNSIIVFSNFSLHMWSGPTWRPATQNRETWAGNCFYTCVIHIEGTSGQSQYSNYTALVNVVAANNLVYHIMTLPIPVLACTASAVSKLARNSLHIKADAKIRHRASNCSAWQTERSNHV